MIGGERGRAGAFMRGRKRCFTTTKRSGVNSLPAHACMHPMGSDSSAGRAAILADAGAHRLLPWQFVRVEAALRERLDRLVVLVRPAGTFSTTQVVRN